VRLYNKRIALPRGNTIRQLSRRTINHQQSLFHADARGTEREKKSASSTSIRSIRSAAEKEEKTSRNITVVYITVLVLYFIRAETGSVSLLNKSHLTRNQTKKETSIANTLQRLSKFLISRRTQHHLVVYHKRSQDFRWGALSFPSKVDDLFSRRFQ